MIIPATEASQSAFLLPRTPAWPTQYIHTRACKWELSTLGTHSTKYVRFNLCNADLMSSETEYLAFSHKGKNTGSVLVVQTKNPTEVINNNE